MGLDMYFKRKVFVGAEYKHLNVKGTIYIEADGKKLDIDFNKISEISESAGYWRKANHIHAWFVDNVQDGEDDCKEYYVSEEKMKELLEACELALANKDNPDKLKEVMPTRQGFFFGGDGYDEYYFSQLEYTANLMRECIDKSGDFYYRSSW